MAKTITLTEDAFMEVGTKVMAEVAGKSPSGGTAMAVTLMGGLLIAKMHTELFEKEEPKSEDKPTESVEDLLINRVNGDHNAPLD